MNRYGIWALAGLAAATLAAAAGETSPRRSDNPFPPLGGLAAEISDRFPVLASALLPSVPPDGKEPGCEDVGASGWAGFRVQLPESYGGILVAEADGVRIALRALGSSNPPAGAETGNVSYRGVHDGTDSLYVVRADRAEEFLLLRSERAPRRFAYEILESRGAQGVFLHGGAVRFVGPEGRGVEIARPWVLDSAGRRSDSAVRWELGPEEPGRSRRLELVLDPSDLRYPLVIDPTLSPVGNINTARRSHAAVATQDGKVYGLLGEGSSGPLDTVEVYDPRVGTWSPVASPGPLPKPRYGATATLLKNGKIFVTGGEDDSGSVFPSARVFDPAAGTWPLPGSLMGSARRRHTATLLNDGRVLVVGGNDGAIPLQTAEVYDPVTQAFTPVGPMAFARESHTATLLQDGRVLVVGGGGAGGVRNDAEIFDPSSNSFLLLPNLMSVPRTRHTATALPDGKVLLAGGETPVPLDTSEIFDPILGTFSPTSGSLTSARAGHTATLLPSGNVLVAFGSDGSPVPTLEVFDPVVGTWSGAGTALPARTDHSATLLPSGEVLLAGGMNGAGAPLSSTLLFDPTVSPAKGGWTATGSMGAGRSFHTLTTLPSGKVLAAFGYNSSGGGGIASAEVYDPSSEIWSYAGSSSKRYDHTATLLPNGKVLVAGGRDIGAAIPSAVLFDPAGGGGVGSWTSTGNMVTGRWLHTATLLADGKVLVAGGQNASGNLWSAEIYDPVTGTWTATGNMVSTRCLHTAALLPDGRVLVAGGFSSGELSSAELYDPESGTWATTGSFANPRRYHTMHLLPSGKALLIGGYNGFLALASCQLYDPAAGTWTATGDLVWAQCLHISALLPNGKVLVAGGNQALSVTQVYNPALGTWAQQGNLNVARFEYAMTLLGDGRVLVSGGTIPSARNTAEVYDAGLGFSSGWRPTLSDAPETVCLEDAIAVSGSGFQGVSETSGGNGAASSATNYPLLQLRSLATERTAFLPCESGTPWSDTTFGSTPLEGFPYGYALATVFANGIPSESKVVLVAPPPAVTSQPPDRSVCAGTGTTIPLVAQGFRLSYRWQISVDGVTFEDLAESPPYSGVTTHTLSIGSATPEMNGNLYRCAVSGCPPGVVSNPGTLAVSPRSTPVLTGITDEDPCAPTGVRIAYAPASGASRHDLYRNDALAVSGYVSNDLYVPGTPDPCSYFVRAVGGACHADSAPSSFADAAQVPPPVAPLWMQKLGSDLLIWWTQLPAGQADFYEVMRSLLPEGPFDTLVGTASGILDGIRLNLAAEPPTAYYKVRAVKGECRGSL